MNTSAEEKAVCMSPVFDGVLGNDNVCRRERVTYDMIRHSDEEIEEPASSRAFSFQSRLVAAKRKQAASNPLTAILQPPSPSA